MKTLAKTGLGILILSAIIVFSMWVSIEIQGGGPPHIHKLEVARLARSFNARHGRWPENWNELLAGVPQYDAELASKVMTNTSVTPYPLKSGDMLIVFEWKQFGYNRASSHFVKASE